MLKEMQHESVTVTNLSENNELLKEATLEISDHWSRSKDAEKRGAEFGRCCYEWQTKLREKGLSIKKIWDDVGIPHQTAYRWINTYLIVEGEKTPDPRKPKTNADILKAMNARLLSIEKALEKFTEDWEGWNKVAPKETETLKMTIRKLVKEMSKV